jgi:cytochrome bd-type quinol oxidase subunit 2
MAALVIWLLGVGCVLLAVWAARRICDKMDWSTGWAWAMLWPLVNIVFALFLLWHALPRAGRSRWLMALMIVPLFSLPLFLLLAFQRWPEEVETDTRTEIPEIPWRWGER